ncbi:hypothetical protein ACHQM5_020211 [Ranunculus cassubicifolius]
MVTERPLRSYEEIGMLLQEQRHNRGEMNDRERELNIYRSGSAPPTVEGSLSAFNGVFNGGVSHGDGLTEEEIRSDPAYLNYYYSNVNLNPRLPPPLLSKEERRFAQRLQGGGSVLGGIGDRRKVNRGDEEGNRSLFSAQPAELKKQQGEWGGDGLIGLSGIGLGGRQKSFADIFQDDLGRPNNVSGHLSRPASRNAFIEGADSLASTEAQLAHLHQLASADALRSANIQALSEVQSGGASHTFASALGASLSRSNTPDPQLAVRVPTPSLPPVGGGRINSSDKRVNSPNPFNSIPASVNESADLVAALSSMNLSKNVAVDDENHLHKQMQQEIEDHQNYLFNLQGGQSHMKQNHSFKKSGSAHLQVPEVNNAYMTDEHVELLKSAASSTNSYRKGPSMPAMNSPGGSPSHYQSVGDADSAFANYGGNGHSLPAMMASQAGNGNLPLLYENVAAASAMAANGMDPRMYGGGLPAGANLLGAAELQNLSRMGNHMAGGALQLPLVDPLYLQYLRTAEYAAAQAAALSDPSVDGNYVGNPYVDLLGLQKAYLGALLSPQKSQYGVPYLGKSGGHNYYGNPAFGLGMSYPGSPLASPGYPNSPGGPGSPLRHHDRNMRLPSGMRNLTGWHPESGGNLDESFASSLLEEFKSNKTKCFELLEIEGHVVEFSADQYGSRFIQQKLETATTEEKNMVFQEIMPQAFSLMTDVFGNYVIQKFFEHGTASQRRELADQLTGHVLTLSLQMYGCRVIQKAIEVVDLDQQTQMVAELDGHIMRCVRDQNGNHVIQKCIECIPQEHIEFIVSSFYDQVVTLSTHPYGCRVIQRVLEHCDDPKTQQIMMDEIMQHVCKLAKDQYGNYVVQHVLEHGKPHERTNIITQLAGQIVEMSQQKFASNVVEKCLAFGDPAERQILVNEMLGSTEENEPLQAMMKDQFANYVVQKVLETCEDQQRELILSRIKVHLNALKKYTYGKHIVARVEKLVAAGERRIGMQTSSYITA